MPMTKSFSTLCLSALSALSLLTACQPDTYEGITPIVIGEGEPLTHISINRDTERHLILSGGNGKYRAYSSDRRLMEVQVHQDTLKIRARLEGEAYATVHSHDLSARLDVSIIAPELTFTNDTVRLYPKQESRYVSLLGGGDVVTVTKDDPDDILTYKWNGNNSILEINAHYEGEAVLTATTVTGQQKHLVVLIHPVDEPAGLGIYSTGGKFYSSSVILPCRLCVVRDDQDLLMSNVCNPHGGRAGTYSGTVLGITTPENPEVGQKVKIQVTRTAGPEVGIAEGIYDAVVDAVRGDEVHLRTSRHKFVLPYRQTR